MANRKRIKPHRKPKIVRDKSWKSQVLSGEIGDDLVLPRAGRILPRGREEEKVRLWKKVEAELSLDPIAHLDAGEIPEGWRKGTVIRVSTGLYDVDPGLETVLCSVRGSLSASETGYTNLVAVGDEVLISQESAVEGVIERVLPRRTVLARPNVFNEDMSQVLVSNVDQLLIVASWVEPMFWVELIDRALIAAAEGKMRPLICVNKIDLVEDEAVCREWMRVYEDLDYTVLFTSAVTGQGVDELRAHLTDHSTVVVGLSGVGKSSLLMAVQPDLELRAEDISEYTGQGRHTTTQISLLRLHQGGYVVDTPGICELGLIKVRRHELVLHFPEIAAVVAQCRFNDCTHTHEPGCAVLQAVNDGRIVPSRYDSYQSIYASLPEYYKE